MNGRWNLPSTVPVIVLSSVLLDHLQLGRLEINLVQIKNSGVTLVHHDQHLIGMSGRKLCGESGGALEWSEVTLLRGFDVDQVSVPVCKVDKKVEV